MKGIQEKAVPSRPQIASGKSGTAKVRNRPFRVLVVDGEAQSRRMLDQCSAAQPTLQVLHAPTLAEARRLLQGPIDLAVIDKDLPDGSGLDLADEVRRSRRITQMIVISTKPSLEVAMQAIRLGASDYLVKPINSKQFSERIRKVIHKQKQDKLQQRRIQRLRRLCKKLNQARLEVTQQVDILCNDLVTAYHDLAGQMQHIVQTSEFGMLIRDELDFEDLIRKTLEYLIENAGATNAAVFLPSDFDEYTLSGYVNYDCTAESADMLLEHLADVLIPKVVQHDGLIHVTDNQTLGQWIGDDAAYLADCHLLTVACLHEGEALAVITLFRDGSEPYQAAAVDTARAVGSILGEALARIIRVHHRHPPDTWPDEGDGRLNVRF